MKLENINKQLTESSLNRIYHHMNEATSWAILTSWRNDLPTSQNKTNFSQLKSLLRSEDLGFIILEGHGQEEDPETNEIRAVVEPSIFIPNISFDLAIFIMKKYKQFGILYSGPETDNKAMLVDKTKKKVPIGHFTPNKMGEFYSKVKGKPFVFELDKIVGL